MAIFAVPWQRWTSGRKKFCRMCVVRRRMWLVAGMSGCNKQRVTLKADLDDRHATPRGNILHNQISWVSLRRYDVSVCTVRAAAAAADADHSWCIIEVTQVAQIDVDGRLTCLLINSVAVSPSAACKEL